MIAKHLRALVLLAGSLAMSWVWPAAAVEKDTAPAQSTPAAAKSATNYGYGSMEWVDPDRSEPAGTKFKTFHSNTIDADVSYLVYLPPEYEKNSETHYPVLYELHASGGMPSREARAITPRFDRAMRSGKIPPMIIVYPNGLRGATMYSDTKNGEYPVESVIIKDLIPHIDATYRTIVSRAGRALDGFSMGGFGAAHLGFKYPELFGVVSIQAPPLLGPDYLSNVKSHNGGQVAQTLGDAGLMFFGSSFAQLR